MRGEAIARIHGNLVESKEAIKNFVFRWEQVGQKAQSDFDEIEGLLSKLRQQVQIDAIYLSQPLYKKITETIEIVQDPAIKTHVYSKIDSPKYAKETQEAFNTAVKAVADGGSLSAAIEDLRKEFRALLGSDSRDS